MKIILHIGPHKTGTTAIQEFLYQHAARLARSGIHYPNPGADDRNHHGLVIGLRTPTLYETTVEALRQIVWRGRRAGYHTCIFSSEVFVEHEVPIHTIQDIFAGCEVHVLAYLRRPDHLWASAYAQLVKEVAMRRTQRIDEDPVPYDCSYATVLPKWMEHFAPGRMMLAPFDPPQWAGGDLCQDFLRMIGFEQALPTPATMGDARNQSLPGTLLEALRVTNEAAQLPDDLHQQLVERLEALARAFPQAFGPPVQLPTAELRRQSFALLEPLLEVYRPYYRPGFDDAFLRWRGER